MTSAEKPLVQSLKSFVNRLFMTIGLDPTFLYSLRHYRTYRKHLQEFRRAGGVADRKYMVLRDFDASAGLASGHYFHQDLLVAQFIYMNNPVKHVDIGSRIDGFVAHVASFREIEVLDIRELSVTDHKNIRFCQADLLSEADIHKHSTPSLSCLHALEHMGLGRYGDTIDPNGHINAFNNLIKMLHKGGLLYVSFPIADTPRVFFNAHRVFHYQDVFFWAENDKSLKLERFDVVDDFGKLHQKVDPTDFRLNLQFGCGIYTFRKL